MSTGRLTFRFPTGNRAGQVYEIDPAVNQVKNEDGLWDLVTDPTGKATYVGVPVTGKEEQG